MSLLRKLVSLLLLPLMVLRGLGGWVATRFFGFHPEMTKEERQQAQRRATLIIGLAIPILMVLLSFILPDMQTHLLSQAGRKKELPPPPDGARFGESGGSFKVKERPPLKRAAAAPAGPETPAGGKSGGQVASGGQGASGGGGGQGDGGKASQPQAASQAQPQSGKKPAAGEASAKSTEQPPPEEAVAKPPEPVKRPGDEQGPFLPLIAFRNVQTFYGLNVPERGVRVYLENNGGTPLMEAVVSVALLDGEGKPLLEKKLMPLVVSGGIFGDRIQPLAPGKRHPFFLGGRDVPESWAGETRVRLESYRFAAPAPAGKGPS